MKITIIVVNWNSGFLLEKCLDALVAQTIMPSKIIIADNCSTDGSIEYIKEDNDFLILKMQNNLGFAAANNQAFKICDTDFIALLNPDAFPEPDWLENLLIAAQANPHISSFGSRQMKDDAINILDGVGDIYHMSGLAWRDGYGRQYQDSDSIGSEIFSPCAGAALYRREALMSVGGFDEDFFCYMEDIDLGFRLQLAGYKSMYVPNAVVRHIGSATTGGQRSDFSVYHGHRNMLWVFVKNMPSFLFWLFLPLNIVMSVCVIVVFVVRGQGAVILRAKKDAIKGLPKMWAKRRIIQAGRKVSLAYIWKIIDKRLFR